ncbi:MAG: serine/threonine protein kinase, partial [Planctomycetia bacterium]|nr:serine/threonine protein kinase [Planctomycetia bacterium]
DGFRLGQYVILERLGSSALGRVFKAKHRTMNRAVAIKVLASALTSTHSARQDFQREVRAAGKLTHPNIITAYDANEYNNRFYLVMEFVDGTSLDELIRAHGPLPIVEACEVIRQLSAGLHYAHKQGMVHHDLSPDNILIARPSSSVPLVAKIAEFGIAKLAPGSPDYAAPELPNAPRATAHLADLYSLGCVFYFLFTGRPPFVGGTAEEKARKHMWDEPQRIEELRSDVPQAVSAVVHRLLAKYPDDRFASAAELLSQLNSALVPVLLPIEADNPELSPFNSDYLTGRTEPSSSAQLHPALNIPTLPATQSPWAQITDEAIEKTLPLSLDETPLATPHKPTGLHGEQIPWWVTPCLLAGVVLFCMLAIGIIVKLFL